MLFSTLSLHDALPISAVVGALIWFFTQTETGQKIIETVWGAIKTAIGAVWDWLKGVFDGMKEGIASVGQDRKSTRLNSSHVAISYAVFCLKKKNKCYR